MKDKDYGKLAKNAAIIFAIIGVILPIIFKYAIFENSAISNLNNAEWASFLGSYAGGLLGGIGTLLAVFITVKSSQQIQENNKKETDQRIVDETVRHQEEIKEELLRREAEHSLEILEKQKTERTKFADDIADKIGVYITHISKYHYSGLSAERLHEACAAKKAELIKAENEVERIVKELINVSVDDEAELVKKSEEKQLAENILAKTKRLYQEAENEYKENLKFGIRIEANEAFFTIKTKLYGISEACSLLVELETIHRGAGVNHPEEKAYGSWMDEESKKLMEEFSNFKKSYVENQ